MFGSSSERRIGDIEGQLSLFNEMDEVEKPVELIEPEIIEIPKHTRKKKPTLEEQFKDIPTRQVLADTLTDEDKICPECGSEMLAIGTEKSEARLSIHHQSWDVLNILRLLMLVLNARMQKNHSLSKTTENH